MFGLSIVEATVIIAVISAFFALIGWIYNREQRRVEARLNKHSDNLKWCMGQIQVIHNDVKWIRRKLNGDRGDG